jgi:hypothetical protein
MEPNFIRIGPPPLLLVLTKLSIQRFLSIALQGVARTHNHASDTGGGWARQIVALTHKNNRDNFSSYHTPRICVYSQKSWSRILFGSPTVKLLVPQGYQYNCFGVSAHLQGTHKIMHPTPAADGPLSDCCSYTQE